ncbi:MAG: HAD family hydrolase [Caldilineaceae bacterium]
MIEAITFDFWDTLAIDDSDEAKRAKLGLPSKQEARTKLFVQKVITHHPEITARRAVMAYQRANERFRRVWHDEHHTPTVATRISYAYEELGLLPPPGQYARLFHEIDELIREIEVMEVRIPPDFAPGVHTTLEILAQQYKLAIISDTIHTNGRGLRGLLSQQGLLQYFSQQLFSDEVGVSKPSSHIFRQAAAVLDIPPDRIVHIGDRESNDIEGPLAVGMRAILFTGIIDRNQGKTRAHAICRHFSALPEIIPRLR